MNKEKASINLVRIKSSDNITVQNVGANVKIPMYEKFAFGSAAFANNIIGSMVTIYLLYFYTDIFGISAAFTGMIFLVVRIINAVFDLGMGVIIDKTRTRWGKLKPYLLFGAIPLGAVSVLTFTTPNFNLPGKQIYAFITYMILMLMTSVVFIPYNAMVSAMTQDSRQRTVLSIFSLMFAGFGGIAVTVAVPILVPKLAAGNISLGYTIIMLILAFISILIYIWCGSVVKERCTLPTQEAIPLKIMLKATFGNKPLIILCLCIMFVNCSNNIRATDIIYYLTYCSKRPDLISVYFLSLFLTIMGGMLIVPIITRFFGKRNSFIFGLLSFAVLTAILFFIPYSNIVLFMSVTLLSGLTFSFIAVLISSMLPDTVEYAEWKYGVRTEGIIFSFSSFATKLAIALGGSIPAFILSATKYIPGAQNQTESAVFGISAMLSIIPAALVAISAIFMIFYDLDDKKFTTILNEIKAKKVANINN